MAYTPKGYTDRAAIEAAAGVEIPASDEVVDEAIAMAEAIIDAETGRDFSAGTGENSQRLYDGDGTDTLFTGEFSDLDTLRLDPEGDPIDGSQFVQYPAVGDVKNKIKLRYMVFPVGLQNIVLSAKFGTGEVKADIKRVATLLALGAVQNSVPSEEKVQSYSVGRYSVTFKTSQVEAGVNMEIEEILQLNKRYAF